MRQNTQPEKESLTSLQKQAVLVCVVCALAILLTVGITLTLLKRGKESPAASDVPATSVVEDGDLSDHYQINETSSALLTETADAGEAYLNDTLFLGDSNTVRLYQNGLISLQQFCAKEGIGTQAALTEGIVTFKKDNNSYTIAQAVAKMKPRRVVIMLGTNDNGMAVEDYIRNYTALVQAIQESYPYTDIIVNTVPPVPENHSNYPNMDQSKIDDFNMALLSMCEQLGVKFLNSAEVLKDDTGYGNADYYQKGDIHLKPAGLKAMLNYLRTHAYETEDRRPDTSNIPTRTLQYSSNPSSAVEAPSSSEAASESADENVKFEAGYHVDKTGGGTLSGSSESGKTSLTYNITDASQSISVTAVPDNGYVFVKWSDGVTKKTRTDTNFKQNLDVTAVFAAASVQISSSESKATVGSTCTFKAKLSGKYLAAEDIRWYANGTEVSMAAGRTTVQVPVDASMAGATFKVYAVVTYNDCTVTSNTVEVSVPAASSSSSSSSSSSTSSSSTSTGEESGTTSSSSSSVSSSSNSASHPASSASSSHSTASSSAGVSHSTASSASSSTSHSTESSSSSHAASSESKAESASLSHASSSASSEQKAESKAESTEETAARS